MNAASNRREIVHIVVQRTKRTRRTGIANRDPRTGDHAPARRATPAARATATMEPIVTLELINRPTGAVRSGRYRTREMLNPRVETIARRVALEMRMAPTPISASWKYRAATAQNANPRPPA